MDSSKKVKDCKKILSTITDPPAKSKDEKGGGKCLPISSKLPLGLGIRSASSLPLSSPFNRSVTHKLDFSDESALLNNSSAMEITACSPPAVAGAKRKVDQQRLLREGELTSAQGKITSLESLLESERNVKKRLKIEQEKEVRDAQAEKISLETRNKDLLDKLRRLEQAKIESEQTASQVVASSLSDRSSLESEKRELDLQVHQLKTEKQKIKNALDYAHNDIDRLNDSAEYAKENMDLQIEEMQQAAENDRDRIERLQEEVEELRECRNAAVEAENRILDLNNQIRLLEEEAQLGRLFKEQSSEIRRLQLANDELCERNRILSTTQEDTSVLQEKLRSAESKIKRADERIQDMTRLDLEITKLRSSLSEWESVLSEVLPGGGGVASSRGGKGDSEGKKSLTTESLRQYLAKSQHDLLFASEQRQKTELELGAAHDSECRLREEFNAVQSTLLKEQQQCKKYQELLIKLRKKYQLITKERDSYRSVLNSYESEMTTNPAEVDRKRLEDLEEVLAGYRREVDKEFMAMPNLGKVIPSCLPATTIAPAAEVVAEAEAVATMVVVDPVVNAAVQGGSVIVEATGGAEMGVAASGASDGDAATQTANEETISRKLSEEKEEEWRKELEAAKALVSELETENAKLKEANDRLSEETEKLNDVLEEQKMKGDYDPTNTKVVHMRFNPFEMMKQKKMEELKDLKIENDRLIARIRVLEQVGREGVSLTQRSEEEAKESRTTSSKEVEELKAKINAAELKNKRLVEAFQKTSQDLREAVFRLFGYKLDIPTSKQYKLMSMYAESPEDFLLFSQSGSGEMQLLATAYSDTLADLIDAYLSQADSIPAFLASVSMDLFNKQTLALT